MIVTYHNKKGRLMKHHNGMTSGWTQTRKFVGVVVIFLVIIIASVASGLTKDDVVSMSKAGIDDSVIVTTITGTQSVFNLTPEDLKELRDAGVSENLIQVMLATAPKQSDPITKPINDPGDEIVPAIEPPNDDEEKKRLEEERLRQEAERKRLEEERIKREAEKLKKQEETNLAQQRQITLKYKDLKRAKKLIESGQAIKAIRLYREFLDTGVKPNSEEYYNATFGLGWALYEAGLHNLSAPILLKIVMLGPERTHFEQAFYLFYKVALDLDYLPPTMEKLEGFYVSNLPQKFQDQNLAWGLTPIICSKSIKI